jgi:hypothetical protein
VTAAALLGDADDSAIRRTLNRYTIAVDRARPQEVAATFVEDGVLHTLAGEQKGRAAILAALTGMQAANNPRLTRVRHHLTTCLIDFTAADRATARTYFFVVTDIGMDHTGSYHDVLHLQEGQWLFKLRRVFIDWISPTTLFDFSGYRLDKAATPGR